MWTAHVVRNGAAALDALDDSQQTRAQALQSQGVASPSPAPTVGHDTHALPGVATARPSPPTSPSPARTGEPRIPRLATVGIVVGAVLLFGVGISLLRQGVFTVTTTPSKTATSVTLDQPDYRVSIPNRWPERTASGSLFDAVYSVPDREILNVGVVDFADPSLADAAVREEHLAIASDMVADAIGDTPVLVDRSTIEVDGKTVRVATYDHTDASGIVTRVREYIVVGPDRAVIVTAYGTPRAIDRHDDEMVDVAKTTRFGRG